MVKCVCSGYVAKQVFGLIIIMEGVISSYLPYLYGWQAGCSAADHGSANNHVSVLHLSLRLGNAR